MYIKPPYLLLFYESEGVEYFKPEKRKKIGNIWWLEKIMEWQRA